VSIEDAKDIGLLGFVGRASGHSADERIEEGAIWWCFQSWW